MFPFKKGDSKVLFKKGSSMQKWEYYVAYVEVDEKQKVWVARLPNGKDVRLSAALAEMGENGWEICGSTQATSPTGTATGQLFEPSHWLYFKRPKV